MSRVIARGGLSGEFVPGRGGTAMVHFGISDNQHLPIVVAVFISR